MEDFTRHTVAQHQNTSTNIRLITHNMYITYLATE